MLCVLQMTRVGAVVNDIRKKVAQSAPELSKRCRALIKCWQKLAEPRPTSSGSSSTNGTPSYTPPAIRKGLTPGTPARGTRIISSGNSRLTPAGNSRLTPSISSGVLLLNFLSDSQLRYDYDDKYSKKLRQLHMSVVIMAAGSRSTVNSPTVPNGRRSTPHQRSGQEVSPNNAESETVRNSCIVGSDLAVKENSLIQSGEIIRNGKRKGEAATPDIGITNGLNTVKRPNYSSAVVSPTTPHQSLLAARRADVKSTSELVAQLTENLPGYLAINMTQGQSSCDNESENNEEGQTNTDMGRVSTTPVLSTLQTEVARKKERRNRSKKDKEKDGRKKGQSAANDKLITASNEKQVFSNFFLSSIASTSTVGSTERAMIRSVSSSIPSNNRTAIPVRNGRYDWCAMLPSLETLRNREHFRSKPSSDQRKSYIMNVLGREVLALPYIDVGLPDFLEYQYPKPERFYAEENFIYGASRPN
uniref:TFIIS N-terminal domain-containing protein n=1 Tax=Setaria digitata TaxID=48799 RepID=A0A915PCT4_9BILA